MTLQEHIDDVMDWFDFEKVHKMMKAVDWKWGSIEGVPDIPDLRQFVRKAMKKAYEQGHYITGGFDIRYNKEYDAFTVQFIGANWETNLGE